MLEWVAHGSGTAEAGVMPLVTSEPKVDGHDRHESKSSPSEQHLHKLNWLINARAAATADEAHPTARADTADSGTRDAAANDAGGSAQSLYNASIAAIAANDAAFAKQVRVERRGAMAARHFRRPPAVDIPQRESGDDGGRERQVKADLEEQLAAARLQITRLQQQLVDGSRGCGAGTAQVIWRVLRNWSHHSRAYCYLLATASASY